MRAAAGDQATVSGLGAGRSVVASARRATVVQVSDALRAEVGETLDDLRPRLAQRFDRRLDAFEAPVFLRYGPGDYFVAHQDGNTPLIYDDTRFRQVSVVILLSEPETYRGGALVLHAGPDDRVALTPAPGTLVAFRAETTHEVMPVTAGERLSVVSWCRRVP